MIAPHPLSSPRKIATSALHLAPGEVRTLSAGGGLELSVVEGIVWVTQSGDSQDYLLAPGEVFHVYRPGGRVVIQALRGAAILQARGPA
jgi:hypothetical protein